MIASWVASAAGSAALVAGSSTAFATAAFYTAYAAVYVGFTYGVVAYNSSQNAKARRAFGTAGVDQGRAIMTRDPIAPRRLIYGTVRVSGTIIFMHTTGTKNEYLHLVIVLAGHECADIGDIYFNDELVELSGSTPTGKYASVARINKHLGTTGEAADSDLVSEASSLWTINHKVSGCAYLAVRLKWSPELFPNGLPTISAVVRGKKVYDPRTATTAWSDNAALCAGDFLMDSTWGRGVALARIRDADWEEAANICDENVVLGDPQTKSCDVASGNRHIGCASVGGILPGYVVSGTGIAAGTKVVSVDVSGTFFTVDRDPTATNTGVTLTLGAGEVRYTCNGIVTADQQPAEVLRDLAGAMAGHLVDTGGLWTIRAGAWRTPTLTLTDADLTGPVSVSPRQSRQDTFNGVKGVFISPANQWAPADFPAITNATYMTEDGGVRLWLDTQYNFTTSPATAQRLAKIELERGRQQIVMSGQYMLKAMQLMPGDVVAVTRSRLGWSSKYFEVVDWQFQQTGGGDAPALGVALTLRETAEAVWDWANGEETTIDLAPNTTLPDTFTVPTPGSFSATSATATQDDGTVLPRMNIAWATPNNIYVEQGGVIAIEFKLAADSDWIEWAKVRGDLLADTITGLVIGESYNFRARFINHLGVRGAYSSTATTTQLGDVTAPATPTGLAATAGTGKLISLNWNDNTEPDLGEYLVYRHTADVFGSASLIAQVSASRFVDAGVSYSTLYYYWIKAVDTSENASSQTASVNATTGAAPAGIDTTPPGDPAAATLNTSGTYLAGDGAVLARLVFNLPALTSGAVALELLYRRNGSTGWEIADVSDTGGGTAAIDDLSPAVSYDVACRCVSAYGYYSAEVNASASPYTAPSDTTAPSVPSGLTAVQGTGKSISLDWSDVTTADFSEYGVYRSVNGGAYSKIAETRASRFVDAEVSYGSSYLYKVTSFDRSENESGFSNIPSAVVPVRVPATETDLTAPTNPTAATFSSSGTYSSGDGTVLAYITISVPALPTLATRQNVLYKINGGGGDWQIAAQLYNTGTQSVRIDDLTPGVSYDLATQSWSAFDIPSASVVAVTGSGGSPYTAPNKTSAAGAFSSTSLNAPSGVGIIKVGSGIAYAAIARFTAPTDKDLVAIEIKTVATNSETSTVYSWGVEGSTALVSRFAAAPGETFNLVLFSLTLTAGYVFVRSINASGVYSTSSSSESATGWSAVAAGIDVVTVTSLSGGGAALLNVGTGSGAVAAGDDSRITGALQAANNLSDIPNDSTARSNLGLGTRATQNTGDVVLLDAGSVSAPRLSWATDTDTGWYLNAAGDMRAATSGTLRFVIRDGALVCLVPLKLDNNFVSDGAITPTGYVTLQDGAGTTYKVLVTT